MMTLVESGIGIACISLVLLGLGALRQRRSRRAKMVVGRKEPAEHLWAHEPVFGWADVESGEDHAYCALCSEPYSAPHHT